MAAIFFDYWNGKRPAAPPAGRHERQDQAAAQAQEGQAGFLTLHSQGCNVVLVSEGHGHEEPAAMIDIHCEDCDSLDHPQATQDDANAHELKTGHEVVVHVR